MVSVVTLRQVAEAAGVAVSTASRALHKSGRVNVQTEGRIRQIADDLGYTVNRAGRALITGHTGLIGVVVPRITNPYFARLVEEVQATLEPQGRNVVLVEGGADAEREVRLIPELVQHVDGLIVMAPVTEPTLLAEVKLAVPLVTINAPVRGRSGVEIDLEQGVSQLAEHLADLGVTRIAYASGPPGSRRDAVRIQAVRASAKRCGLEVIVMDPVEPTVEAGLQLASAIEATQVTGVIAFSSHVALGLHFALGNESVEVTAADDLSLLGAESPLLTALRLPLAIAGRAAAEMLAADEVRHDRFSPTLVRREARQ